MSETPQLWGGHYSSKLWGGGEKQGRGGPTPSHSWTTAGTENAWVRIRIVYASKIASISLPFNLNMCFGCSKEQSHWASSFEYPQHMFWLRNKKNNFLVHTLINLEAWKCSKIFQHISFSFHKWNAGYQDCNLSQNGCLNSKQNRPWSDSFFSMFINLKLFACWVIFYIVYIGVAVL